MVKQAVIDKLESIERAAYHALYEEACLVSITNKLGFILGAAGEALYQMRRIDSQPKEEPPMDLQKTLTDYCKTKGLSCQGCEIAPKIGARPGVHDGTCARLVGQEPDKVLPFLQDWYNDQPFIPKVGEAYFFVGAGGEVHWEYFNGTTCRYEHILNKNSFRTEDAAYSHREEILAKYDAIDYGRYPD